MSETKTLLPHQQRVVDERQELDGKIQKLGAFFDTEIFKGVDADEQERLHKQYAIMHDYSNILQQRIDAFPSVN